MFDRVVWESRHKFVYYDYESINLLRDLSDGYPAKINSEEPIVVYILDEGLPSPSDGLTLNKDVIKSFHARYYELLIFLSIIDEIVNNIDDEELNKYLVRFFKLVSYCGNGKIDNVDTLRTMLIDSKNMYRDAYMEYITSGNFGDFYSKVPIQFVMMDDLLSILKEKIGLKKYFSLMLELGEDISIYSSMAINDYIASRCNGYLSMNVLLHSDSEWKGYYSNNGQFIQAIHDYTEVDFRSTKKKEKTVQS